MTRSTKLDRLNVIAKGLSELREIIYATIPGITKSNASRGYRENLLATESHPLLIISKKDAENMRARVRELEAEVQEHARWLGSGSGRLAPWS